MDSTTIIPTTPHRGFDPLIEDEEEACLVHRITLTSYDDLYRLEKASVTPDDLSNSELTRFSNDFARCFGVFLFDVRLPHPTEPFLNDLRLWIKEHRHQSVARSCCCRQQQRLRLTPSPLWQKSHSYSFIGHVFRTTWRPSSKP